jgi:hypothetical protein
MTLTRGQKFPMNGHVWRVVSVSELRAHCIATVKEPVTVNDRKSGGTRTFVAERRITIDISPNSAVELLGRER